MDEPRRATSLGPLPSAPIRHALGASVVALGLSLASLAGLARSGGEEDPIRGLPPRGLGSLASEWIVTVRSDHLLTPEGLERTEDLVVDLEASEPVRSALWAGNLLPGLLAAGPMAVPGRVQASPLARGILVASDGRTLLVFLSVEEEHARRPDTTVAVLGELIGEHDASDFRTGLTGLVPVAVAQRAVAVAEQGRILLLAVCLCFLVGLASFRQASTMLLAAVPPCVGLLWTLGLLSWLEMGTRTTTRAVLPVIVMMFGLSQAVHLLVAFRNRIAAGEERRSAAITAAERLFTPCSLSALTTAIAFLSLCLADSPEVSDMGISCAIGLPLTLACVFLLVPIGCARLSPGRPRSPSRLPSLLAALLLGGPRRIRTIAWGGIASTLLLGLVGTGMRIDQRVGSGLAGHPASDQMRLIEREFGGLGTIEVRASAESTAEEAEELIAEASRALRDVAPEIGPPRHLSPRDGGLPPYLTRVVPWAGAGALFWRIPDLGLHSTSRIVQAIRERVGSLAPGGALEVTGSAVSATDRTSAMVEGLGESLAGTLALLILVIWLTFRQPRLAAASTVVNVLPMAGTTALLAASGYELSPAGLCALTVSLGIAVDDTIHFLAQYTRAARDDADDVSATRSAYAEVCKSISITSVVTAAGFLVLATSSLPVNRSFALVSLCSIGLALVGDLVVLPCLLAHRGLPAVRRSPLRWRAESGCGETRA